MLKNNTKLPTPLPVENHAEYLKDLSQRVYNIIQIIQTHCKEPVSIDKELMHFYNTEREKLEYLLSNPPEDMPIKFKRVLLDDSLISSHLDTARSKHALEGARDELSSLLSKVQSKRTGPINTGIEDGFFKNLISEINAQKDKLSDEKTLRTQKTPIVIVDGDNIKKVEKTNKNKFPHKLPSGTRWEEVTIKFLDEENVFIKIKQFECNTNYKKMGFVGRGKDSRPSVAWPFLKVLAGLNGELSFNDPESRDKYKKQKETLSRVLQEYFSIEYDPFFPYRSSVEKAGNSYKIKILLIPPPKTEEFEVTPKDDSLGVTEYLSDVGKETYDDENDQ